MNYKIKEIKVVAVHEDMTTVMPVLSSPEMLAAFWDSNIASASWYDAQKECMVVMCLNTRRRLICWNLISLGSATASLCHPREVFRPAIVSGAACVAIMHNHPSGDPAPSESDIRITKQINQAGQVVGIDLIDHVIKGDAQLDPVGKGSFSFRFAGLL